MATYKVLQDIEAEDKFLGPLTLKQFIYGCIAAVCIYLSFIAITRGVAFIAFIFLPFILVSGFFAWPFIRDQPTEVWALAKIRFLLKPRRRIWDQSGIKELVTITAPKRIERILSKNFSETEVKSRLEALANTIDSRGWAVKNVNVNLFNQPAYAIDESDRLLGPSNLVQDVPSIDIQAADDILDETSNPTAQHFNQMIASSTESHKQQAVANMKQAASGPPPDYWFMRGEASQPTSLPAGFSTFQKSQVVNPGTGDAVAHSSAQTTADDQALLQKIHSDQSKPNPAYGHTRTIRPLDEGSPVASRQSPVSSASQATSDQRPATTPAGANPALQQLARNDDLDVATIARQADKSQKKDLPGDEVVVSLR